LSSATRKDLRRKLRGTAELRIETRASIQGLEAQIASLFAETLSQSKVDYGEFEDLHPSYLSVLATQLGQRAQWNLYWLDDQLIAFNLLLVGRDRVVDSMLGMRYPLGPQHNIYAVSWMQNVRFCIERGIGKLQTGRTAYIIKARFGSDLEPLVVYARHRIGVINALFKAFGPRLAFDKHDPELKALAARRSKALG
jgi:hypothetical protein